MVPSTVPPATPEQEVPQRRRDIYPNIKEDIIKMMKWTPHNMFPKEMCEMLIKYDPTTYKMLRHNNGEGTMKSTIHGFLRDMVQENKIRRNDDGTYEVVS